VLTHVSPHGPRLNRCHLLVRGDRELWIWGASRVRWDTSRCVR
jgi:hypothetical protein